MTADRPEARATGSEAVPASTQPVQGQVVPRPRDDAEALRQDIERTREQLGDAVEALAAKADVKARTRKQASDMSDRLKSTVEQAKQQAAARAGRARTQLAGTIAGARQSVQPSAESGRHQAQSRHTPAGSAVRTTASGQVTQASQAVRRAASDAGQRRKLLLAAAGVAALAYLVAALRRRR